MVADNPSTAVVYECSSNCAGSSSGTANSGKSSVAQQIAPPAPPPPPPNEVRATLFFGTLGATASVAAAGAATGLAGKVITGSGVVATGAASGGLAVAAEAIKQAGNDARELLGQELDREIEEYKERTGYDSRNAPRYNPFGFGPDE